jgi:hypothetical protein
MWKFEEQFRKDNPQTIGETDKHFDLNNYKDWLEMKLSLYMDATAQSKWVCQKCGELVDGRNVTFEEYHEGCGGRCI